MRIGPYARVLLILVVVLVSISLYAMERMFYWRTLYYSDPQVRIEQRSKVVGSVGMICGSPDGSITINCTVATDDTSPNRYYC